MGTVLLMRNGSPGGNPLMSSRSEREDRGDVEERRGHCATLPRARLRCAHPARDPSGRKCTKTQEANGKDELGPAFAAHYVMTTKTEVHSHMVVEPGRSGRSSRWKKASVLWIERRIRVLRRDARQLRRRAFGRPAVPPGEPLSLAHAIEHASRSLAIARDLLATVPAEGEAPARELAEQRVRSRVAVLARLLEDARDPKEVSPGRLEGAAFELDRGLTELDREDRCARHHHGVR
jgi:hypothetical protein